MALEQREVRVAVMVEARCGPESIDGVTRLARTAVGSRGELIAVWGGVAIGATPAVDPEREASGRALDAQQVDRRRRVSKLLVAREARDRAVRALERVSPGGMRLDARARGREGVEGVTVQATAGVRSRPALREAPAVWIHVARDARRVDRAQHDGGLSTPRELGQWRQVAAPRSVTRGTLGPCVVTLERQLQEGVVRNGERAGLEAVHAVARLAGAAVIAVP
jgi:hypothetical protein